MGKGLLLEFRRLLRRPSVLFLIILVILLAIMTVHLGTQPDRISPAERTAKIHSQSLNAIFKEPVNAPHDILTYVFYKLGLSGAFYLRLASVLWGALFTIAFYKLNRLLFGRQVGLFGALLLLATPLFLLSARSGTAAVMLFSTTAVMAAYTWQIRTEKYKAAAVALLIILSAILLYIPGLVWFLGAGAVLCRKQLKEASVAVSQTVLGLAIIAGLALLVPLVWALVNDWTIIKSLALVPSHFASPLTILKNIGWMAAALFVKTPYHSDLIVGRLPLINVIQTALLIFGAYAMWAAAKRKLWALVAIVIFATAAAGLNNNLRLLALGLPALLVLSSAGLRYLYIEWRGVFPRNPVAKALALLAMSCVIIIQLMFGMRYALVAWPHTPNVKDTYVIK